LNSLFNTQREVRSDYIIKKYVNRDFSKEEFQQKVKFVPSTPVSSSTEGLIEYNGILKITLFGAENVRAMDVKFF
jgi:hypothetical protein